MRAGRLRWVSSDVRDGRPGLIWFFFLDDEDGANANWLIHTPNALAAAIYNKNQKSLLMKTTSWSAFSLRECAVQNIYRDAERLLWWDRDGFL
jgi:hypothetical protein